MTNMLGIVQVVRVRDHGSGAQLGLRRAVVDASMGRHCIEPRYSLLSSLGHVRSM